MGIGGSPQGRSCSRDTLSRGHTRGSLRGCYESSDPESREEPYKPSESPEGTFRGAQEDEQPEHHAQAHGEGTTPASRQPRPATGRPLEKPSPI